MAKIERCDGCGKLSPDEKGLWVGNHWVEVKVVNRKGRSIYKDRPDGDYLFCQECLSGEAQANKASTGLGLLIVQIGKAMGLRPSQ